MDTSVSAVPAPGRSLLYRFMFVVAALVAAVLVVFFFIGIGDGTVSSFNIVLWLGILGATGAILFGGHALHRHGYRKLATTVLAVLAVPGLLYAFFILLVIVTHPRWN